jgi:hypothetical protein
MPGSTYCRSRPGQQEAGAKDDGGDHHRAAGAGTSGGTGRGDPGGEAGVLPQGRHHVQVRPPPAALHAHLRALRYK